MNNRAAALSAVLELSRAGDDDPESTREILAGEMDRVLDLVKVIRSIGVPREGDEAIAPADLAGDLQSILSLHADLRDRSVKVSADGAPPVRIPRWMLLRALVALGATRRAPPGERSVTITLEPDGDWLRVRASGTGERSRYAAELASAMGGEPLDDGGFRVPTLEAVRRREAS